MSRYVVNHVAPLAAVVKCYGVSLQHQPDKMATTCCRLNETPDNQCIGRFVFCLPGLLYDVCNYVFSVAHHCCMLLTAISMLHG